jgi:hypothetical protein
MGSPQLVAQRNTYVVCVEIYLGVNHSLQIANRADQFTTFPNAIPQHNPLKVRVLDLAVDDLAVAKVAPVYGAITDICVAYGGAMHAVRVGD